MATDTQRELEQIEKTTQDITRVLEKARKEIEKSANETNIWTDATKTLQSAQNGINSTSKIVVDLGKQHSANIKERSRLQNEELRALDQAKSLLETRKAQNDALIASTTALLSVSAAGSIEAINAKQKLNELTGIGLTLETDLAKNKERSSDITFKIIPALDSANAKLRDQAKILHRINREEKVRKELAEKMAKINESLIKPLIGDSKEYGKIVEFTTAIMKKGSAAFLAMITASLERFKELDQVAGDFRDKTGFLVTQTRKLDKATRDVNVEMSHLGVGIKEAYESAAALTNEFQVVGLVTKDMIASTAQMAANLGISVTDAAKFRGLFTSIAKSSGTTAEGTMLAASALAEMAGVAPSAVMKDMAEASENTLSFLAKSPIALVKATVEARRLGTTVNALSKSARGFLNYQESITSELEASALLGKALNFQEARLLAYQGKVVESREAAMKQIERAGNFTAMSVYQQEALAKAAGMTVDEVIKQQNQRKMLSALERSANKEDREAFAAYKKMQEELAANEKAAEKNLEKRGKDMVKMQLRQRELNKLTNALASIWTDITDTLLPIANFIVPLLVGLFRTLAGVIKVVGSFLKIITIPLQSVIDFFFKSEEGVSRLESAFKGMNDFAQSFAKTIEDIFENNPILKWAAGIVFGSVIAIYSLTKLIKTFSILRATLSATGGLWSKLTGLFSRTPIAAGTGGGLRSIGGSISSFLGSVKWSDIAKIAAMMVILAGGIWTLGKALQEFKDVKIEDIGVMLLALGGLTILGAIAGKFAPVALGMIAVGAAAALMGVGMLAAGKGFEFMGKGMEMILKSVRLLMKEAPKMVQGFIQPLEDLAKIEDWKLAKIAVGITAIGAAFTAFALSSAFGSVVDFFGGDGPIKNMIALGNSADGLKKVSDELDNISDKYKSLAAQLSEKIKMSIELEANTVIEVKYLDELKETVNRLINAINSLGGVGGTPAQLVNVNTNGGEMVAKLDELIGLLKDGSIGVNIDGMKASKLLARAS